MKLIIKWNEIKMKLLLNNKKIILIKLYDLIMFNPSIKKSYEDRLNKYSKYIIIWLNMIKYDKNKFEIIYCINF